MDLSFTIKLIENSPSYLSHSDKTNRNFILFGLVFCFTFKFL